MAAKEIQKDRKEKAEKWDLIHRIINTVRQAKGVELRTTENPYVTKVGELNA